GMVLECCALEVVVRPAHKAEAATNPRTLRRFMDALSSRQVQPIGRSMDSHQSAAGCEQLYLTKVGGLWVFCGISEECRVFSGIPIRSSFGSRALCQQIAKDQIG